MRIAVLFSLLFLPAFAQDPWKSLEAWAGEWTAEDSAGTPGQASAGAFSFTLDLDKKIMIRRNFAEYRAAGGRPSFRHEDLMVLWPGPPLSAIYWDNEGHVIRYTVTSTPEKLQFASVVEEKQPRYRLTYVKSGATTAALTFEIAPPGSPDAFKTYLTASLRRRK